LGAGCGYLFTKPYRKRRTSFAVVPIGSVGECVGVRAALVF